jgi:hypothetical protein
MILSTSQEKGDALEEAVRLIEAMILDTSPGAKDTVVTIERKKIVIVQGVKHEIDLFITIDLGKGYTAFYIFECKNWIKGVGKNSIIVFSEKINVTKAQKGYFIAKRFGKHAIAQAKKDNRVELLTATTELDVLPPFITSFHMVHEVSSRTDLSLRVVTNNPRDLVGHTDTSKIRVRLRNEELSYQEFAQHIHDIVFNDVMNHEPTGRFSEGIYPYDRTRIFTYQPGELFIDGLECRELEAHVTWESQILYPKIVSQFDIQTRGRVVTQEFDKDKLPPGLSTFQMSFINIDQ